MEFLKDRTDNPELDFPPEPVGLLQPAQEPSAEVTATEEQLLVDLLLKGLENHISMFNDIMNSQEGRRQKLLHCLA